MIETLKEYNRISVHGFDCKIMAQFLEDLNGVLQAQGNKPIVYHDYTI